MAGLQGVGKTTVCGKLALSLQKQSKKVLLVATDVYRPAAIDQLKLLGQRVNVPVFELGTGVKPADIARQGVEKAHKEGFDAVIIDTAGRLQVSSALHSVLASISPMIASLQVVSWLAAGVQPTAARSSAIYGCPATVGRIWKQYVQ